MSASTPIFNIQSYSIHDGPGIRTTVFVKGCPLRCIWCANPESQVQSSQLMTYASKCVGCGRCLEECNVGAITIETDGNAPVAVTDRTKCRNCGACVSACYAKARELCGEVKSAEDVFKKIKKDKLFYDGSGGGLTISGGEPLACPQFSSALFQMCQEAGIHTAVESSSYASREAVDMVYPYVNLALLDIKHMDAQTHTALTGVDNKCILENIKYIYNELHVPVNIRIPVVPGCNDTDENIDATAVFVCEELGQDVQIHLLPYHRLGISKSESLGKIGFFETTVPSAEKMNHLKALVEAHGLFSKIGG